MTAGQLAFAFVDSFPAAVLARAVVGAGDAMIFTSVLRLVTVWFLVRQAPLVTQLTGQVGQLGAIVAAAPLSYALQAWGWTRAFAAAASIGVVLMVAVALVVKDSPYVSEGVVRIKLLALARSLRAVWGNPGTRLGLWSHFVSQFSVTVFSLLWGYPFLVRGQGLSSGEASTLLMVMTGWVVVSGLVLGWLVTRYPLLPLAVRGRRGRDHGHDVGRRAAAVDAGADVAAACSSCSRWRRADRPRWSASTSRAASRPPRRAAAPTGWSTSAGSRRRC